MRAKPVLPVSHQSPSLEDPGSAVSLKPFTLQTKAGGAAVASKGIAHGACFLAISRLNRYYQPILTVFFPSSNTAISGYQDPNLTWYALSCTS